LGIVIVTALLAVTEATKKQRHRYRESEDYPLDDSSIRAIEKDVEQTPASDRQWKVVPKKKSQGKQVHIYLDGKQSGKQQNYQARSRKPPVEKEREREKDREVETITKRTPELTTRSDKEVFDNEAAGASYQEQIHPSDAYPTESEHHEHVIKEKIKIKHHHHHHHHNHIKTVVKKEPFEVIKVGCPELFNYKYSTNSYDKWKLNKPFLAKFSKENVKLIED
jgi:hypothetical protein